MSCNSQLIMRCAKKNIMRDTEKSIMRDAEKSGQSQIRGALFMHGELGGGMECSSI